MGYHRDPDAQAVSSTSKAWKDFMEKVTCEPTIFQGRGKSTDISIRLTWIPIPALPLDSLGKLKQVTLSFTALTWKMGLGDKKERRARRGERERVACANCPAYDGHIVFAPSYPTLLETVILPRWQDLCSPQQTGGSQRTGFSVPPPPGLLVFRIDYLKGAGFGVRGPDFKLQHSRLRPV